GVAALKNARQPSGSSRPPARTTAAPERTRSRLGAGRVGTLAPTVLSRLDVSLRRTAEARQSQLLQLSQPYFHPGTADRLGSHQSHSYVDQSPGPVRHAARHH